MRRLAIAMAVIGPIAGLILLVSTGSPPANAHGTTVRVSWSGIQPPTLTVRVGTEVHFHNANSSGSPCTVVAEDGSFESPTLGRAEGWHHVFAKPGSFAFHLVEQPGAKGKVVVVEE